MLRYEVTMDVEPRLSDAIEIYLRREHIPDMKATGCFVRIRFDRASDTRLRTCYHAETMADLDRYLKHHSVALRAEVVRRFPEGVTVTRETWEERETWN